MYGLKLEHPQVQPNCARSYIYKYIKKGCIPRFDVVCPFYKHGLTEYMYLLVRYHGCFSSHMSSGRNSTRKICPNSISGEQAKAILHPDENDHQSRHKGDTL